MPQVPNLPDEMASHGIIYISKLYVKSGEVLFSLFSYLDFQPSFDAYGMFIKIFWNGYYEIKGTGNPTKIVPRWLKGSQIDKRGTTL